MPDAKLTITWHLSQMLFEFPRVEELVRHALLTHDARFAMAVFRMFIAPGFQHTAALMINMAILHGNVKTDKVLFNFLNWDMVDVVDAFIDYLQFIPYDYGAELLRNIYTCLPILKGRFGADLWNTADVVFNALCRPRT